MTLKTRLFFLVALGIFAILIVANISWELRQSFSSSYDGNSQTKMKIASLKTALVIFQNDVGRFPFVGRSPSSTTYELANTYCLASEAKRNVLINASVEPPFEKMGLAAQNYARKWKGPYMPEEYENFMFDGWDRKILLRYGNDCFYLQSAGSDGKYDPVEEIATSSYNGDDIFTKLPRETRRVTKMAFRNLQAALTAYEIQMGSFPFVGQTPSAAAYDRANDDCLGLTPEKNVLVSSCVASPFENLGRKDYASLWHGPFAEDSPEQFMLDGWDRKICLRVCNNHWYLHSAGPDGVFEPIETILACWPPENDEVDFEPMEAVIATQTPGDDCVEKLKPANKYQYTQTALSDLKGALIAYHLTFGSLPFVGKSPASASFELANEYCLGTATARNVLVNSAVSLPFENLGLADYQERWQQPFLFVTPEKFMRDGWAHKIVLRHQGKDFWLHSAGPDGAFDPFLDAAQTSYKGDDLVEWLSEKELSALKTRRAMDVLAGALITYEIQNQYHFPFLGSHPSAENFDTMNETYFATAPARNVLVHNPYENPLLSRGSSPRKPVIEGSPAVFMLDAWGNKIQIRFWKGQKFFLHSAGPDGLFDPLPTIVKPSCLGVTEPIETVINASYKGDDLLREFISFDSY